MKKLLVIAPQNPYPATDGGKIGIYYPLITLAKSLEIHFAFTTDTKVPAETENHFKSNGIKIYPQYTNTKDSAAGIVANLFSALPYKFQKYCKKRVLKALKTIVHEEKIDYIWCNHSHVAWYGLQLKKEFGVKIFLREHNIEYFLVQQALQIVDQWYLKPYIWYQFKKTKQFEIACWKKFDKTFFISDSDYSIAKTEITDQVPTAVLYDSFYAEKSGEPIEKEPFSFIFTGSVGSFQNSYNIKTFVEKVWLPLIEKDNRWKLYITGNADEVIRKTIGANFEEKNIVNLGFVENIASVIAAKKYFISPTYIGSGIRIKVLNAMCDGAVCFVTPLDAAMLKVLTDMKNIATFEGFADFLSKLSLLESDEGLYNAISLQALEAGTYFTWEDYGVKVNDEIENI